MALRVTVGDGGLSVGTSTKLQGAADGDVENTDQSYQDTVAPGGTLVIPDITITKNDDSTVDSPAAIDLDLRIIDPFPTISPISETVENALPTKWVFTFGETVTLTDETGWTLKIGGTPATITGVVGDGTTILTFTTTETVVFGDVLTFDYNSTTGDVESVATSLKMGDITGDSVTNNIELVVWTPADLAKAERTLLSDWDASDASTITEETGVSVMADKIGSNDFVQTTGADQPAITDGGTTAALITYDGVSEFLAQVVNSGNFQDITKFEWWGVVFGDSTNEYDNITFNDVGFNNDFWRIIVFTDNKVNVQYRNNSLDIDITSMDTGMSNGYHVVGVVADGVNHKIYVDNVLQDVSYILSPDGKFLGSLINKANYDSCGIGVLQLSSNSFYPNKERHQICFGGTDSAALSDSGERTEIFDYLNEHHNLGL